jgi:hypothetical protein
VADTKAENSGLAAHKFKPGQSGNPGGRPKGFASTVQDKCGKDGKKLVEAACLLAWGTPAEVRAFFGEAVKRDGKVRLTAIQFLADRGYGKAVETVEVSGPEGKAMSVMFGGRYKPKADG